MLRIRDTLAGNPITIHYGRSKKDYLEIRDFIGDHETLAMDTESTGINCYKRGWELRTVQYGNGTDSYVIPARCRNLISLAAKRSRGIDGPLRLIGHNGPHDARCIDTWVGYETGLQFAAETYIPSHHADSRNRDEGGIGHGLKELGKSYVDPNADKWEKALKEEFKKILIRIPGEYYKSSNSKTGTRKGDPKFRKAKYGEAWGLIDPENPAYLAYAGADPIINWHVFHHFQPVVREFYDLYTFDRSVAEAVDRLQRRAIRLDVPYTEKLSRALARKANLYRDRVSRFGCDNINSGQQVAETLLRLDVKLYKTTESGQWSTDAELLRKIVQYPDTPEKAKKFIGYVLLIKQLEKRKKTYTDAMLAEMDENGRVHTGINSLAARTTRMSASNPPFQQLPTKDHSEEESI